MPNPLGADLERCPYRLRTTSLPSVTNQVQTTVARVFKNITEPFRRSTYLVSTDAECHGPFVPPRDRELRDFHSRFSSKVPNRIDNPECLDAGALRNLPDGVIHSSQILLLPQNNAGRERDLRVGHAFRGESIQQTSRGYGVVLRLKQILVDPNVALQEFIECAASQMRFDLRPVQRRIDLEQRLRIHGAFQMHM